MSRLLRADLDELDTYVTRIAKATGTPSSHIEKDYWVTEVLRGAAAPSRETGCSMVFKGGTSLSKAHHLIQRFSEDIDLIAVLLHHAAIDGDDARKAATARHYYDVDRLLRNDDVVAQLHEPPIDVLAREVCEHSRAADLPTADRPKGGFAASPAWNVAAARVAATAYTDLVLPNLVWPGAPRSTFDECCERVRQIAGLL
jgi:hypothetical protein